MASIVYGRGIQLHMSMIGELLKKKKKVGSVGGNSPLNTRQLAILIFHFVSYEIRRTVL